MSYQQGVARLCVGLAGFAFALTSADSHARIIRIDQGSNWGDSLVANIQGDGSRLVDIGFSINFGAGSFSQLIINENGFVSFADGSTITGLDADFVSNGAANDVEDTGAITYTQGIFDFAANFEQGVSTPDAFRVQWVDQLNSLVFQILLLDQGAGNFDLEINHGCDDRPRCDDILAVGNDTTAAGYALGANVFNAFGPFAIANDFTFQFRNGAVVQPPTAVAEPGSFGLLMAGLFGLIAVRRRRRG